MDFSRPAVFAPPHPPAFFLLFSPLNGNGDSRALPGASTLFFPFLFLGVVGWYLNNERPHNIIGGQRSGVSEGMSWQGRWMGE